VSYIPSPAFSYNLSPEGFSSYVCPSIFYKDGSLKPKDVLENQLLGWMKEALEEGSSYLKQCRAYQDIDKAIDIITSQVQSDLPISISKIFVPSIKRDVKEMVAILANIRPSWLYETRAFKNQEWAKQARIQNGLSADWYNKEFVDRRIKSLLQLGIVEGTGYISPIWNPSLNGLNRGGIELKLYRYDEFFPIQVPKDFNIQNSYAGIISDEMGINRARKVFPHKANLLIPDRGQSKLGRGLISSAAKGFWDSIWKADSQRVKTSSGPVIDIFYSYIDDFQINPLHSPYQMGESSWGYEVPYVGQQIPDGFNQDGSIRTKKASYEDCYLYPNKRLVIASRTAILYDGPSYWWHGRIPIIKYSPDDWIFSYLGFSMAAEVSSMQNSSNKMRRSLEDALHLTIDPPMAIDETMMSKTASEKTSLRIPGRRIRGKLAMGDFMKPITSPEYYRPTPQHFDAVQEVETKIKEILGLPDLKALQQAKQVPSSDSIEKFFSQAGAIVTDMSRSMDKPMYELADMNRYYFYQFYTLEDRIKILGEDGITEEDFDFVPGSLIPASLPNEPKKNYRTGEIDNLNGIYLSKDMERAKKHIRNFKTTIHPTSLHQITHMSRKLLLMQASKLNPLLVDPQTLAEALDIENWGRLDGDTVLEKVQAAMKIQEKFGLSSQFHQGLIQLLLQSMAQNASPEGQLQGAMSSIADAIKGGNGSNPLTANPVGRPPSLETEPRLLNKPGDRTTLASSSTTTE